MGRLERLYSFMIKPWVFVVGIGFIILSFIFFDRPTADYFNLHDAKTKWIFFSMLTELGSNKLVLLVLFLLSLFFRYIHPLKPWEVRSWFLFLFILLIDFISLFVKIILGRARPCLWFDEHIYGFYGMQLDTAFWSVPSGHTTTVMGLVFGLCFLFPRYFYGFLLMGLAVIISRVVLSEHYLSDVLITSYLVLVETGLLLGWLQRKNSHLYDLLKGR